MSRVYEDVLSHLTKDLDRADLEKFLCPSFGFLSGFEFRESLFSISPKCGYEARRGMVFQLYLGFANVTLDDDGGSADPFSVCLGDCVVINTADCVVLTEKCKRSIKSWKIVFQSDDETAKDAAAVAKQRVESAQSQQQRRRKSGRQDSDNEVGKEHSNGGIATRAGCRGTRKAAVKNAAVNIERATRQKELLALVNRAAKARLLSSATAEVPQSKNRQHVSYERQKDFPFSQTEVKDHKIFVDRVHNAVVLPIFNYSYAFHISTIKNVSETVEGQFCYLRINFTNSQNVALNDGSPRMVFIKELTYRAANEWNGPEISRLSSKLNTACQAIRDLQKRFRDREAEKKEMEGVVSQGTLNVSTFTSQAPPRLRDLMMRPSTSQRKVNGTLEGYSNGVRYVSQKSDKIDILFSNVKHAFYQTCDNEMIIGLHFNLLNPIMIGKRKQSDIQFFRPIGEIATDLNRNRGRGDADEFEVEQAEREMKQKCKAKFGEFVKKLEEISKNAIRFETTIRELGFYGTPSRAMCMLTPTHSCLVNLTEWPPFVVSLDEVELVHFERVDHTIRNFDMVFVPKDYFRKVRMICSIDSKSLEGVKDWLTNCDLAFTEGLQNMNWHKVMRAITDDYSDFFKHGGWNFLANDSEHENGSDEASDDDDEVYEPSDEMDSLDDDDDDDVENGSNGGGDDEEEYSGSETSSESNSSEGGDDEDDEGSGKGWSELEEEARREDAAKMEAMGNAMRNGNNNNKAHKRAGTQKFTDRHQPKKRR